MQPWTMDPFGYGALHDTELLRCSQQSSDMDVLWALTPSGSASLSKQAAWRTLKIRIAADDDVVQVGRLSHPGSRRRLIWEGSRYCVPIGAYYQLLFYRHDLFEAAGKEPPEPHSMNWRNWRRFSRTTQTSPASKAFATNNARGVAAGQEFYQWLPSAGGRAWASNEFGVTPEARRIRTLPRPLMRPQLSI